MMLAEYRQRRDFVIPRLRAIPGVECSMPAGAFYAYPNVSGALARAGSRLRCNSPTGCLKKQHVAVVPGEAFGTATTFASRMRLR